MVSQNPVHQLVSIKHAVESTIPTGEHTFVHQGYVFHCFSAALVVSFHKSCVEIEALLKLLKLAAMSFK